MRLLRLFAGVCVLGTSCVVGAQTPGAKLDEMRLRATWFEAARLPDKAEKTCVSNPINISARADKNRQLRWLWVCTDKKGNTQTHTVLVTADKQMTGKYKSTTLFILHKKYNVIALADDNSSLILGSPNHKRLWLFTADPRPSDELVAKLKAQAQAAGYDTSKLMHQPQTNPPKVQNQVAAPKVVPSEDDGV